MTKTIKKIGMFAMVLCLLGFISINRVNADENRWQWKKDKVGWWIENDEGKYVKNGWSFVNGKWYLFDEVGYMKTGWEKNNGKWYFLNPDGDMATGWKLVDGKWYYLYANGTMAENVTTPDGYQVSANGEWIENFNIKETKHYKFYDEFGNGFALGLNNRRYFDVENPYELETIYTDGGTTFTIFCLKKDYELNRWSELESILKEQYGIEAKSFNSKCWGIYAGQEVWGIRAFTDVPLDHNGSWIRSNGYNSTILSVFEG